MDERVSDCKLRPKDVICLSPLANQKILGPELLKPQAQRKRERNRKRTENDANMREELQVDDERHGEEMGWFSELSISSSSCRAPPDSDYSSFSGLFCLFFADDGKNRGE